MAEGLKVRLVRCPNCDNVLPEPPDYSVYQCGGCGTVLRAKKKAPVTDGLSEKSYEERVIEGSKKNLDGIVGENGVSVVIVPETEMGSAGIDHGGKEDRLFQERAVNLIASSSSRTQDREAFTNADRNKGRETVDTRLDQTSVNKDGHGNRWGRSLNCPTGNWVHGDGNNVNLDRSHLNDLRVEKEPAKLMHPNGSVRLRETTYRWGMERDGREESYGNSKSVGERGRFSAFVYPNEGHLNYQPGYVNSYDLMKHHDYMDGPKRVEELEHDRAELRRKLDELKDQLSRSCDVADNPKEKRPIDRRVVPPDPYGSNDIYMSHPYAQGNATLRTPFINRNHGPVPSVNRHEIDIKNFFPPPRHTPIDIPGYEDPFRPQMLRRPPQKSASQYPSLSSYNNISGRYLDISHAPLAPYPHETYLHHPSCSCLPCNYRNWQVPPQSAHSVFGNRRFYEDSTLPTFYHDLDVNPVNFGPRCDPSGVNTLQLHSQYPKPHKRSPSDIDSDFGGISRYRPRRVVVSHGNRRLCRPLAGGAPFLICYNCLKLLKVPRKIMRMEKNKRKLQCGACATIILFNAENKGLIVSIPKPTEEIPAEIGDGSGEGLSENCRDAHDFSGPGSKTSCPEVGSSPCNFQSTETEANLLSNDQSLNMSDSENRQGLHYLSPIYSEEKESPDLVIVHKDVCSLAELSSKDYMSPPLSVSPIKDICSNHAANRFENGNKSNRTYEEKVILNNSTSRHNSVNYVSVASEIELSLKEYSSTGLSQDSAEVGKEDHLPKINKGSRSFFSNLIKKSFKDFSRSSQSTNSVRANVSVNGQPLSNHVVEKVEKLAGPIQPGEYWYDFRAGFWGVMGRPCHGIIPPNIQEFDYPMPEKCGAGNTCVYVNGRELHQKDLDLLVSRGLPSTKNKYYIVEISGKVMDEESGKELDDLGKLAPTVEKTRQGFGMKVPQVAG